MSDDRGSVSMNWNLRCSKGHRHWSTTPEKFDGLECLAPLGMHGAGKCHEPLKILKLSK